MTDTARETAFVYVSNNQSNDITIFGMHPLTGELRDKGKIALGGSAMPLVASPNGRFLYAEYHDGKEFLVASMAVDPQTGGLDMLSIVPLPANMVYLAVDATGRFLLGASYHGDVISVNPIGPEGFVQAEPVCMMKAGRHAHAIKVDPSNRFAYVPYLGNDYMTQLLFDEKTGNLTENTPAAAVATHNSGPRHFCFSPNGRYIYVLNEMSGTVACFVMDRMTGTIQEQGSASIVPPGVAMDHGFANYYSSANIAKRAANPEMNSGNPKIWSADIHMTPNGRFVYASERATSIISYFAADTATGKLTYVDSIKTEKQPRSFKIDSKGRFLVVAGEKSNQISVYAINQNNGGLEPRGQYPVGTNPGWVEIVTVR